MKRIIQNTLSILNGYERKRLVAFITLNLFISIVDIASLASLVLLISVYTQGSFYPKIADSIQFLFKSNSLVPISVFLILFILKSIAGYWVFVLQYKYVYNVASRISRSDLLKYLEGSYSDYVQVDSSVHVRKIMHQPIEFAHYVLTGILQIITESILAVLTITAIVIFNVKLFLLLAVVLLPAVIIISYYTKKILKQARAHAKTSSEKSLQHLHEALSGYIESNIYNKNEFFTNRYSFYLKKMTKYLSDLETTQGIPSRLIEVFAVLGLFLIVVANKFYGNATSIEIINVGAFIAAAYKIIPGIVKISNLNGQVKTYEYTITDLLKEKGPNRSDKEVIKKSISAIAFNNICFSQNSHIVLDNFDFEICKGEFIGITGPSGKGKTTFVSLLLGFLSQGKGDISINGANVDETERKQYWESIAYVQQRPFLIHDTIKANITLCDDHNDDAKLNEVIKAVGIHEFIGQSSQGINKVITENGKNISGGQRQRISIARALYKDSDLIILDEPFSEIDSQSEKYILDYLKSLSLLGKMIIIITHKKENLLYCDKTYIID